MVRNFHWTATNTLNLKAGIIFLCDTSCLTGLLTIMISIPQNRNPGTSVDSGLEREWEVKKKWNHPTVFQRVPMPHFFK